MRVRIVFATWLCVLCTAQDAAAAPPVCAPLSKIGLVDVAAQDSRVKLDIKYATRDNFPRRIQYPVARCLLQRAVAAQLRQVQDKLDAQGLGLRLLLKDCYRPITIQRQLFDSVAHTPQAAYVANPNKSSGAVHTFGAAVDLTLVDTYGVECDMGTSYDDLGPLAEPRKEAAFFRAGKLTQVHLANRKLLREVMRASGFIPISNEWWHFDALQGAKLRQRYVPLDVDFKEACTEGAQ